MKKTPKVFCNESIINVYLGQPENGNNSDYFLDCYYDMSIHLCGKYRLILETENYYLSLETTGAIKIDKSGTVESIKKAGEWIDPCVHIDDDDTDDVWVDYESTLFVGERLLQIEQVADGYLLTFDDFNLKLVPHLSADEFPCTRPHSYSRVYGTERLINRCPCGGTGEMVVDFVSDYGIRCNKCRRGTVANPCACDAIDEWNSVADLPIIGNYPEEDFNLLISEPIEYIIIERFSTMVDADSLHCDSIIIKIGNQLFNISSRYAGGGKYAICYEELSNFNPIMWPQKISAKRNGSISLQMNGNHTNQESHLIFRVGERILTITADKSFLTITPVTDLLEKTE